MLLKPPLLSSTHYSSPLFRKNWKITVICNQVFVNEDDERNLSYIQYFLRKTTSTNECSNSRVYIICNDDINMIYCWIWCSINNWIAQLRHRKRSYSDSEIWTSGVLSAASATQKWVKAGIKNKCDKYTLMIFIFVVSVFIEKKNKREKYVRSVWST